jgi:hypothetical protein
MRYNVTMTTEQKKAFAKLRAGLELTIQDLNLLAPVLHKVGENFGVIAKTTNTYMTELKKSTEMLSKAFGDAAKSFLTNVKAAVVAGAPQVFNDLMAQAQNAVGQSNYSQAAHLGVSQAELAQFMGQNRMALRAIGGGNTAAAVNNGQINQLQSVAHTFGLTGNDALKFIGTTFDNMIRLGLTPTVENATKTMKSLYETMQTTGMTFEELNGLVADLSKSPAFLSLVQAKGYDEQVQQIGILTKMLRTQGYSTEYLKQLLDLNKQSQYQGIEEAVKGMVGVQLLGGQINRTLGTNAISNEDIGLLQELKGRGPAALEQRYAAGAYKGYTIKGQKVEDMFGTGAEGAAKFSAYALQRQLDVNKLEQQAYTGASASDNLIGGLVNKTLMNQFRGLAGAEYQQTDAALAAQATLRGLTGTTNPNAAQTNALLGANDPLVTSINDVHNAFLDLLPVTKEFIATMQEGITAIGKNPAGQAGSSILGAAKDLGTAFLTLRGIGTLKKFLPGVGGGMLGRLGGLGGRAIGGIAGGLGSLGSLLGTNAVGALSGGAGAAGAAGSLGLVGAAGAAGYGLGTWANNKWRLSDKLNDAMLREREEAALGPMIYHINRNKNGGAAMPKVPSAIKATTDQTLVDAPLVPEGDTMGDLLTNNNDSLKQLIDLQQKQLELMDATHKEYMNFVTKNSADEMIQNARAAARGRLGAN